jgi:hypothetical protein
MLRVFDFDVLRCGSSVGRMRNLCAINPITGDKENSELLWLAVQTPAQPSQVLRRASNFLRRTGTPSRLLAHIPIIQLAKPVEKGKLCKILHLLIPPRSKIAK